MTEAAEMDGAGQKMFMGFAAMIFAGIVAYQFAMY